MKWINRVNKSTFKCIKCGKVIESVHNLDAQPCQRCLVRRSNLIEKLGRGLNILEQSKYNGKMTHVCPSCLLPLKVRVVGYTIEDYEGLTEQRIDTEHEKQATRHLSTYQNLKVCPRCAHAE